MICAALTNSFPTPVKRNKTCHLQNLMVTCITQLRPTSSINHMLRKQSNQNMCIICLDAHVVHTPWWPAVELCINVFKISVCPHSSFALGPPLDMLKDASHHCESYVESKRSSKCVGYLCFTLSLRPFGLCASCRSVMVIVRCLYVCHMARQGAMLLGISLLFIQLRALVRLERRERKREALVLKLFAIQAFKSCQKWPVIVQLELIEGSISF